MPRGVYVRTRVYVRTPEDRAKISARMIGNTHSKGHVVSDETRAKNSARKMGQTHSATTKKKLSIVFLGKSVSHGHTCRNKMSRLYSAWTAMNSRCYNPKNISYPRYGGRPNPVTVYSAWRWVKDGGRFENFLVYVMESGMSECPLGWSIDRINNERGYEPDNIRWADKYIQANNTRRQRRAA